MAKAIYRLELTGSQINSELVSCTGKQLGLVINSLAKLSKNWVWFVADIEAVGSLSEEYKAGEPTLFGDTEQLITYVKTIPQFTWGIYLAVPKELLPKNWTRYFETEDLPFQEMDGAELEIRTFDTTYIEVYAQDSSLLDGLIQELGGKHEIENLTS